MKKTLPILMLVVFSLLFCSCSKKETKSFTMERGKEYAVGVKINDFETKGILVVEENGLTFSHADSTSPLYGMKETFGENEYRSIFQGMEWKSNEVKMQGELLKKAIESAEIIENWSLEEDTKDGIKVEKRMHKVKS